MRDLNVNDRTIKLLEKGQRESIGSRAKKRVLRLDTTNMMKKGNIDKLGLINIKIFFCLKDFIKTLLKRKSTDWGKMFANQHQQRRNTDYIDNS